MIDKNSVLSIVREKGPVLPRHVVKELGGDTFMVGAVLSQLVDNKEIKISHAKIGGSPVYYVPGQEEKLSSLYEHLHEKEKKAYDLLKEKNIIRDSTAEPVIRVALRHIRDFAKPLEVNLHGKKEIFWKWYLLPNSEAEEKIKKILDIKVPPKQKEEKPKKEEKETSNIEEAEEKSEDEKKRSEDTLLEKVQKIFDEKDIEILETEVIRKNTDIEMVIKIPSRVGKLRYFCKVRDKKRCNDKDLSSAFVQGQMRKLPVLFAMTGKFTKKAEEMLDKEFQMISLLKI